MSERLSSNLTQYYQTTIERLTEAIRLYQEREKKYKRLVHEQRRRLERQKNSLPAQQETEYKRKIQVLEDHIQELITTHEEAQTKASEQLQQQEARLTQQLQQKEEAYTQILQLLKEKEKENETKNQWIQQQHALEKEREAQAQSYLTKIKELKEELEKRKEEYTQLMQCLQEKENELLIQHQYLQELDDLEEMSDEEWSEATQGNPVEIHNLQQQLGIDEEDILEEELLSDDVSIDLSIVDIDDGIHIAVETEEEPQAPPTKILLIEENTITEDITTEKESQTHSSDTVLIEENTTPDSESGTPTKNRIITTKLDTSYIDDTESESKNKTEKRELEGVLHISSTSTSYGSVPIDSINNHLGLSDHSTPPFFQNQTLPYEVYYKQTLKEDRNRENNL